MASSIRPISTLDGTTSRSLGHSVQLYTDDAFLIDVLCGFVGDALAVGDAAVVIATRTHQKQLERKLVAHGLDPYKAIAQGRLIALDAGETLARIRGEGVLDEAAFTSLISEVLVKVQSASQGHGGHIAAFGELVALLWMEGNVSEAIRVEELWNQLATQYSFSLLCAYPVAGFSGEKYSESLLKMWEQHTYVASGNDHMSSNTDEQHLRTIAQLQQKTQVLEKQLALHQSERQFRILIEAVQDYAIFLLDPKGHVVSWNTGAQRIKGYTAAEIIGKHFSCFYPDEDIRSGKPQWELVGAAKEGRFEDEGWRLRKDGTRFWANVIITAIRDDSGKLLGFGKVTRDFTERMRTQRSLEKEVAERKEAEERLHTSEKSLRQLSRHLLRSQDEERKRIGRDLHDSLGQYLAVLKMKLESMEASSPSGQGNELIAQDLTRCIALTQDCIREVRTVSYLLYPPMLEERGLKSAIPWYLDGFSARSGIQASFEVHPDFSRLPRDSELALFRVLQESLTNVHRHSGSSTAQVRLSLKDGMGVLEIEDQGSGISPHLLEQAGPDWTGALGVGLRGMSERMRQLGGRLDLLSRETGTTVIAIVPAESPALPA